MKRPGDMLRGSLTCRFIVQHTEGVATVGDRYQVVIERDVRRELGVHPGDRAVETVEDGRLVITFLPPRHRRSLQGRLAGEGRVEDPSTERDLVSDLLASEDSERAR